MRFRRLQIFSIILLAGSLATELIHEFKVLSFSSEELALGISLGFTLAALSLNVSVVKNMEASKVQNRISRILLAVTASYALLVFGLDLI